MSQAYCCGTGTARLHAVSLHRTAAWYGGAACNFYAAGFFFFADGWCYMPQLSRELYELRLRQHQHVCAGITAVAANVAVVAAGANSQPGR